MSLTFSVTYTYIHTLHFECHYIKQNECLVRLNRHSTLSDFLSYFDQDVDFFFPLIMFEILTYTDFFFCQKKKKKKLQQVITVKEATGYLVVSSASCDSQK